MDKMTKLAPSAARRPMVQPAWNRPEILRIDQLRAATTHLLRLDLRLQLSLRMRRLDHH